MSRNGQMDMQEIIKKIASSLTRNRFSIEGSSKGRLATQEMNNHNYVHYNYAEAEFKEFKPRLKFKLRLKYVWSHLKLYSISQDLSWCSIETGFWGIGDVA